MSKKTTAKNNDTVWSPVVKIVSIVCVLVLIATIALAVVAKSGFFRRNTVVMTVGDTEISALEFNYEYYSAINNLYSQYGSYASLIGLNFSSPLKSQTCYFDSNITWHDYFVNMAKSQLEETYLLYGKAASQQFEMTQESKDSLESSIAKLETAATDADMKVNEYLSGLYGENMTMDDYREFATRRLIAADFYTAYTDGLEYSDEAIDKFYDDNKFTYDRVDYYSYTVKVKEGAEESPEEIANKIKLASTDVNSFIESIKARENADTFKAETYFKDDVSYTKGDQTSEWLFDHTRVPGEVTVIRATSSGTTTYTVVCFVERSRETYQLATMRHILFEVSDKTNEDGSAMKDAEGNTLTDADEQKAAAEALLKQWQDGEKTADSFAALVKDNSDDAGSVDNGGLYEDFDKTTMVAPITEWIWKDGRQPGDCEIVETDFGYHIVYFVSYGEYKWKSDVINALKVEDYEKYLETLKTEFAIIYNEKGFSQVG